VNNLAQFSIRAANLDDVAALDALIESSVRGLQAAEYSPAVIEGALGHALGLDRQLIHDGTYFVAEAPGATLVGCGGWSWRQKLCGSDHLPDATLACGSPAAANDFPYAKIRAIFVHPAWARQGLGTLILQHVENQASAAGFRLLEMGSTLTGVPLYALRGYRETERMGIPLPNGETLEVVRMVKHLSSN
jgi:GNAT superfamily N-acetyltransferase